MIINIVIFTGLISANDMIYNITRMHSFLLHVIAATTCSSYYSKGKPTFQFQPSICFRFHSLPKVWHQSKCIQCTAPLFILSFICTAWLLWQVHSCCTLWSGGAEEKHDLPDATDASYQTLRVHDVGQDTAVPWSYYVIIIWVNWP